MAETAKARQGSEKKPPALKGVSAAERALAVLTAFRRGDSALT
ncbi:transcriptional regulator, partial [Klebsiella pneumoniae]